MFVSLGILLLIIIALVATAVVVSRQRGHLSSEPVAEHSIGTVKRLYFYVIAFAALFVVANGINFVLRYLLDAIAPGQVLFGGGSTERLSQGVAMVVVGVPVWFLHWRYVQRKTRENPAEGASLLRKLYLYAIMFAAGVLFVRASYDLLRSLLGPEPFAGRSLVSVVVWSLVWLYHRSVERQETVATQERHVLWGVYFYLTSGYTLGLMSAGVGAAISLLLLGLYDGLFPGAVISGAPKLWTDSMQRAVSIVVVAAPLWAWHWRYAMQRDSESVFRHVYVHIFARVGGMVTVLISTGFILFFSLDWAIVRPETSATAHFRGVASALSGLLMGFVVWSYHRAIAQKQVADTELLFNAPRVQRYILAGLGLTATVAGLMVLLSTMINIVVPGGRGLLAGGEFWREPVAVSLTILIMAVPIWGYFWALSQREAQREGLKERSALERRVLVYLVLTVGVLATVGGLVHLLFVFVRALLETELALSLFRDTRIAISALVVSAVFAPYYLGVLRQDQVAGAERIRRRKVVTAVLPELAMGMASHLQGVPGTRVRIIKCLEPMAELPSIGEAEWSDLSNRIQNSIGDNVVVILGDKGFQVYSYR